MRQLPRLVHQRDVGALAVEHIGGALGQRVEAPAQRGVQRAAVLQGLQAFGLVLGHFRRHVGRAGGAGQPVLRLHHQIVQRGDKRIGASLFHRVRDLCARLVAPRRQHHLQIGPAALEATHEILGQRGRVGREKAEANHLDAAQIEPREIVRRHHAQLQHAGANAVQRQHVGGHVGGQRIHGPAPADAGHAQRQFIGRRIAVAQLVDHALHAAHHAVAVLGGGHGVLRGGRQAQRAQADMVVEVLRRGLLGMLLGHVDGFFDIARQQALVQARGFVQGAFAAQQHLQKLQLRQVVPQHQQHHRHRRRQHQPDRPPQRGPEHGRQDQRQRRHAGAGAVQPGLDEVVADQLQRGDQRHRPQHHVPPRVDAKRQRERKNGANHRPHVRHEAQHRRQQAPHQRTRHADEQQAQCHRYAVGGVDEQLHGQVLADPLGGIAQRVGGAVQVAAQQAHHLVAQIALVEQDQHHEHEHDADQRQRRGKRFAPRHHALPRRDGLADDLDAGRLLGARLRAFGLALRGVQFALDTRDHARIAVQHARLAQGLAKAAQLARDVGLVDRQVVADLPQLADDEEGAGQQQGHRRHDDDGHRQRARHAAALEPRHHRVQHEADQDRQRQRHQQIAPEVERRHDDGHADQAVHQRRARQRLGRMRRHFASDARRHDRRRVFGRRGGWRHGLGWFGHGRTPCGCSRCAAAHAHHFRPAWRGVWGLWAVGGRRRVGRARGKGGGCRAAAGAPQTGCHAHRRKWRIAFLAGTRRPHAHARPSRSLTWPVRRQQLP